MQFDLQVGDDPFGPPLKCNYTADALQWHVNQVSERRFLETFTKSPALLEPQGQSSEPGDALDKDKGLLRLGGKQVQVRW